MSNIYVSGTAEIRGHDKDVVTDIQLAMTAREQLSASLEQGTSARELMYNFLLPPRIEYTRPYFEELLEYDSWRISYAVSCNGRRLIISHEESFSVDEDMVPLLALVAKQHRVPYAQRFLVDWAITGGGENTGGAASIWCGGTVYNAPMWSDVVAELALLTFLQNNDAPWRLGQKARLCDTLRTMYATSCNKTEFRAGLALAKSPVIREFNLDLDAASVSSEDECRKLFEAYKTEVMNLTDDE